MIQPLRIALPQDSLTLAAITFQPSAVVRNTANGLNIPAGQNIATGGSYQTADYILCAGFNHFSLIAWVSTAAAAGSVDVMAVPISATDTNQQLDGISFGSLVPGGYYRVSAEIQGVFAFYLRFTPVGNDFATLINVLELQMSHR